MLSGVKLVSREDAERLVREERRSKHKEKRKHSKKVRGWVAVVACRHGN